MKNSKLNIVAFFVGLILVVLISGCSDQRSVSTMPPTHPAEWMDSESIDFHGKIILDRGSESCIKCHGDDYDGGLVEISCIDCHISSGACLSCHGGGDNQTGAPPRGLENETARSALAVGAHTVHVEDGEFTNGFDCQICHIKPVDIFDTGHIDNDDGQAEVILGSLAGPLSNYDRGNEVCNNIYCHGSFAGGSNFTPIWTDSSQTTCGSCHDIGDTPSLLGWKHAFHVGTAGIRCSKCHSPVVDDQKIISDLELHINGVIDTLTSDQLLCNTCHGAATSCTSCHGGLDNQTGAPPFGLEGERSISTLAVGAHTSHMTGRLLSDGIECAECHTIPVAMLVVGHLGDDQTAEVNFGSLAGASSTWNRSNATCAQTYCHGNFNGGYPSNSPNWTALNQAVCGSCHAVGSNINDLSGKHWDHVTDEGLGCYQCHAAVVNSSNNITGLELHVNGINDISFSSGEGVYSGGSCSNVGCHDPEDW